MRRPVFVYLVYGDRADIRLQLKYSLVTLLRYVPSARGSVILYADDMDRYARWPVEVEDLNEVSIDYDGDLSYQHVLKPLVVRDMLRQFGRAVVFLDTDTYILPGFDADMHAKLAKGAVLNRFERSNPYPSADGVGLHLPHLGEYRYDPRRADMFNSGVIGVHRDFCPLIEDAIALIDGFRAAGHLEHDVEQFAISEMLRLNGIPIAECRTHLRHYCKRSLKRYVTAKLAELLPHDWDDFNVQGTLRINPYEKRLLDLRHSLDKRFARSA